MVARRTWARWAGVVVVAGSVGLMIVSACLGADRAGAVFRSAPLAIAGVILAIGLVAAMIFSGGVRRSIGLLATCAGAVLVLVGGLAGSHQAHRHWGSPKVARAAVPLAEGQVSNELLDERSGERLGALPFYLGLEKLEVHLSGAARGEVEEHRTHVAVLRRGQVLARGIVSVNHPLHYGGYHLYQHSATDNGATILLAVSDSGLPVVYAGFALGTVGIVWWMWVQPVASTLRRRRDSRGRQD